MLHGGQSCSSLQDVKTPFFKKRIFRQSLHFLHSFLIIFIIIKNKFIKFTSRSLPIIFLFEVLIITSFKNIYFFKISELKFLTYKSIYFWIKFKTINFKIVFRFIFNFVKYLELIFLFFMSYSKSSKVISYSLS